MLLRRALGISRLAQERQRLVIAPLGPSDPARHRQPLNLRLPRPVRVLGGGHAVAERLDPREIDLGAGDIAPPGGTQAPCEPQNGLGLWELLPRQALGVEGQLGRLAPLPALQRVAGRDRREGEGSGEVLGVDLLGAANFVYDRLGLFVLYELQRRILDVVHGVQRVVRARL